MSPAPRLPTPARPPGLALFGPDGEPTGATTEQEITERHVAEPAAKIVITYRLHDEQGEIGPVHAEIKIGYRSETLAGHGAIAQMAGGWFPVRYEER